MPLQHAIPTRPSILRPFARSFPRALLQWHEPSRACRPSHPPWSTEPPTLAAPESLRFDLPLSPPQRAWSLSSPRAPDPRSLRFNKNLLTFWTVRRFSLVARVSSSAGSWELRVNAPHDKLQRGNDRDKRHVEKRSSRSPFNRVDL